MAAPPPPPVGGAKLVTKKIVSETETYNVLNPLPEKKIIPIHNFDWSSVSRLQVSGDGSSGVLFVYNKDGTAVLKAAQGEGDHFANLLIDKLNTTTPLTKVITRQHPSWKQIENIKTDKNLRFAMMDQSTRRRLDNMIKYQQFHLIQLVEGQALHSLDKASEWLTVSDKVEESSQVLFKIGEISAIDTIINNWDRIPSFWKNQGNGGNIMITNTGDVVAIDQIVSTILTAEATLHFEKLDKFLDNFLLLSAPEEKNREPFKFQLGDDVGMVVDPCHRVRAFFINTTGIDIEENGILLFRKGFTSMGKKLATIENTLIEELYNNAWKDICEGFTDVVGMADPQEIQFIMKAVKLYQNKLSNK